jgi:monoamine oxidase
VSYDVVIIGAGAAGLAAAAEIARAGRSALVLEARDRIGGRCWSLDVPGVPVPIELGAEFIHGRPPATFSLLEKAGVAAIDRIGSGWYAERGRLKRAGDIFDEIRRALRKTSVPRQDVSFDTFIKRELRYVSARARAFARRRVEGYDAADPARASARAIVEEWSGEDEATAASHFRPLGGYGALLEGLARTLPGSSVEMQLSTVARGIQWQRGKVEVEGVRNSGPFSATARCAIITLPLGVLQLPPDAPGAVRFTPALDAKARALRGLAPSPVIKVIMRFRTAFWEELDGGRYADAAFLRSLDAPFPSFWTALPVRTPLLVAWAGGPRAERLSGVAARNVIRQATASLETMFGRRARAAQRLEAAWLHDWQQDPFARGAYSYVTVGGAGARNALAAPLQGTLYFAGEASDFEGEHGTVAGALRSGTRAARQVLKRR